MFVIVAVVDFQLLNLGFNGVAVLPDFDLVGSFVYDLGSKSAWSNAQQVYEFDFSHFETHLIRVYIF